MSQASQFRKGDVSDTEMTFTIMCGSCTMDEEFHVKNEGKFGNDRADTWHVWAYRLGGGEQTHDFGKVQISSSPTPRQFSQALIRLFPNSSYGCPILCCTHDGIASRLPKQVDSVLATQAASNFMGGQS